MQDIIPKILLEIKEVIEDAWEHKEGDIEFARSAVVSCLKMLDDGIIRVAEKKSNDWIVNHWIKKAILLSFKLYKMELIEWGSNSTKYYDKIPLKFANSNEDDFINLKIRSVPGSIVRYGSFISHKSILMPCFVNIGAYIGENSLIDTWSTIGSCAQVGNNCHISGGVGLGGVLEPLQAEPVIIEDNCFIGARSEIAEGVIIGEGSVLSMGVYIGKSTKIIDRETGSIIYGRVPPYSVVVPGNVDSKNGVSLYAAIIVKKVDEITRSKTSINDLLRL